MAWAEPRPSTSHLPPREIGGLEPGAPRGRVQLYSSVFLCKDTFIDESFPSFFKKRAS